MARQTPDTAASLLHRIQIRDPEAWQRFVTIYGPLVHEWTHLQGVRASDAEDIVQEVLVAVSKNIAGFRRDKARGSFRKWLWGICTHKIMDYYRDMRSRISPRGGTTAHLRLLQLPDTPPDEESDDGRREVASLRHRAVLQLRDLFEPQVWEAFWRVVANGDTPADVARDLGVSVWAVYKAKSRVLLRLREDLEGLGEE
jgi:RNA polymerase sigma-70 factor (ECF subfamily)